MPTDQFGLFDGSIAHQDGCAVVVLSGEVDLSVTTALNALVDQAIGASRYVVFDMRDVTFLDSSGLGVIAALDRRVGWGGSITVRNATDRIARLFEITGLDRSVTMETTHLVADPSA